MSYSVQRAIPAALLCIVPFVSAFADGADPTQAVQSRPLPLYRSAFADYKPLKDEKPGDWRSLNEAVKGDDMPGMASMPGMGTSDMAGKPGMGAMPGHAMPMPMPKKPATSGAGPAARPASAASAPDMKGMPGMSGHSGHSMPGSQP